jgi:hypothetical protein
LPVEQIRAAVELQAGRHGKGKVVIDLQETGLLISPVASQPCWLMAIASAATWGVH